MNLFRTPPTPQVAIFGIHYNSLQNPSLMHSAKASPQKSTIEQKIVSDPQPYINQRTNLGAAFHVKFELIT
jgi:hypothetical protein